MNVWQIATGRPGRDYRDLFFAYDVMVLGPSHLGDARESDYSGGASTSIGNQISAFADGPSPGDRVIMRFSDRIIGIGEIPSGDEHQYSFQDTFKSVYGWHLSHCRRVRWAPQGRLGPLHALKFNSKRNPSFTRIHQPRLLDLVERVPSSWFKRPLKRMPRLDASLYSEEDFGRELFEAGIPYRNIADIWSSLRQAKDLNSWYRNQDRAGRWPTEHEVITHIVLPLFLGLGWSHQQIAIEWNRVDMAFFKTTPTMPRTCRMLLEAKGLGDALGDVLDQPTEYARNLHLKSVRRIAVTNGAMLLLYARRGVAWLPYPVGYVDFTSLQREYVLPKHVNPVRTLVMLQPSAL